MDLRDPVTRSIISQIEHENDRQNWNTRARQFIIELDQSDPIILCTKLYTFLDQQSRGELGARPNIPLCDHALDSYISDHALLTSAIAYCLGADRPDIHLIRLAALSHEFFTLFDTDRLAIQQEFVEHVNADLHQFLVTAWDQLTNQGKRLAKVINSGNSLAEFANTRLDSADDRLNLLLYAHLAASARLHNTSFTLDDGIETKTIAQRTDFQQHPLTDDQCQIGLVYGGVTKVKQYVFESARLPEIRGASALLDRINLVDLRALWGWSPPPPQKDQYFDQAALNQAKALCAEQAARSQAVRNSFQAHYGSEPPVAPECIIYAGGGNILALAPPSLVAALADTIEYIYTEQTLVAQSTAVGRSFALLELHYGLRPTEFWLDEFQQAIQNPTTAALLAAYYSYPSEVRPATLAGQFYTRKAFGELVTLLAGEFQRRRARQDEETHPAASFPRHSRALPHFDLLPFAIKCYSCDVRPAVITVQDDPTDVATGQSPKIFCEACARKRITGQVTKQDTVSGNWFYKQFTWRPHGVIPWESEYKRYLQQQRNLAVDSGQADETVRPAMTLSEIGAASKPTGYVGLIYADGNNVGAQVARIATPAAYRQFAGRLEQANKAAVFHALAKHLTPHPLITAVDPDHPDRHHIRVYPFEIVTIGGDDVLFFVPGDRALDIAHTMSQHLEQLLGRKLPEGNQLSRHAFQRFQPYAETSETGLQLVAKPLDYQTTISTSAGVVVAQAHMPIFFQVKLVEQLQKSAKKMRKNIPSVPPARPIPSSPFRRLEDDLNDEAQGRAWQQRRLGGSVDFLMLKGMDMTTSWLDDFRQRALRREQPLGDDAFAQLALTSRPYTWPELAGLLQLVRRLHEIEFPRSQRYALDRNLFQGRLPATVNYLYFFTRLRKREYRQELIKFFHQGWATHDGKLITPPWRLVAKQRCTVPDTPQATKEIEIEQWETIWHDLMEIAAFVHKEPRNATVTD